MFLIERIDLMKNRILKSAICCMVFVLLLSSFCGYAVESEIESGIFTYKLSGDYAIITCVKDVKGTVVVPEEIDGHRVVEIGDGAFGASASVTEVRLPDSVTKIGSTCFAYSTSIRVVYLSPGMTVIPEGAFLQASALECVSVPYGIEKIESKAFAQCPKLSSVKIPNSVKTIAKDAFKDTENVTLYCRLDENSIGYKYAQDNNLKTEKLITVYVNGEEIMFDQPPVTDKKRFRTLVPLRAVLEAMGAEIEWYNDMNYAGIDVNGHRLLIKPESEFMMVDGKAVTLQSPAIEYNYRILLPIRDVVEAVGGKVRWSEHSNEVFVSYEK